MNTAWLIEPPRQDISDLYARYDVRIVFRDHTKANSFRDNPEEFFEWVQNWAAEHFEPETHFFVLTGNLTLIVAASMALSRRYPKDRLLFLRFDHGLGRYCEVQIPATMGAVV